MGRLFLGRNNYPAARPRRKKRRGDAPPAPFCCHTPPGIKGRWFWVVAVFTREGARHNGFLCEPERRAAVCPALALCIRRRYVTNRHKTSATRQDRERCASAELPATTALAACEPQGLDGVAVGLGGAMKPAVVKRRRERSGTNLARVGSRWRYYAFGALSGCYGIAMARGLRFFLQAP